jgi:hypothetical protein
MSMGIFSLFLYYAGMYWHEIERLLAIVIKAKSQKAANNRRWSCPWTLKGERRCNRGSVPRGRHDKPGKASVYKQAILQNIKKFCRVEEIRNGRILSARLLENVPLVR